MRLIYKIGLFLVTLLLGFTLISSQEELSDSQDEYSEQIDDSDNPDDYGGVPCAYGPGPIGCSATLID